MLDEEVDSGVKSAEDKKSDVKFGWIQGVLVKLHSSLAMLINAGISMRVMTCVPVIAILVSIPGFVI